MRSSFNSNIINDVRLFVIKLSEQYKQRKGVRVKYCSPAGMSALVECNLYRNVNLCSVCDAPRFSFDFLTPSLSKYSLHCCIHPAPCSPITKARGHGSYPQPISTLLRVVVVYSLFFVGIYQLTGLFSHLLSTWFFITCKILEMLEVTCCKVGKTSSNAVFSVN